MKVSHGLKTKAPLLKALNIKTLFLGFISPYLFYLRSINAFVCFFACELKSNAIK